MPKYKIKIRTMIDHEMSVSATSQYLAERKVEGMVEQYYDATNLKSVILNVQREHCILDDIDADTPFFVAVTYKQVQDGHGNSYPKILTCEVRVFHDEEHNVLAYEKTVDPADALALIDIAHYSCVASYSYDDVATLTHYNNNQ